jgi:hypothetical protein
LANFEYIPIDGIISDFIEDNKLSQENISMSQLKRWAIEACSDFLTVDASKHKIALLDVNNTKAELPKDFHTVISLAYRIYEKDGGNCTTLNRVVEYTQHQYGQDCDLEIRVKCNKCNKTECTCNSGVIEIDVDRVWQMENPWYYNASRFGVPVDSTQLYGAKKQTGFKLMSYSTSDFHNLNFHLPSCVNLECKDCDHRYIIERPFIETDIMLENKNQKAELLLAYYGRRTDHKGDPLVPNIVDASDAIQNHLTYKWFRGEFVASGNPISRALYQEALLLRDQAIARAKTQLATPDVDKLRAELSQVLNRRGRINGPNVWENFGPVY